MEPSPTIFPKSHFCHCWLGSICGRGDRGRGEVAEGHREGTQRGDTNGHGHRGMQIPPPSQTPPWAFSVNKGPRGGRALHHCSLCSQHLLGTGRGPSAPWPQEPRAAQWPRWPGSGLAFFLAPFHQPFSPPPSPGALSARRWLREEEEEEEGGNIGLWRKSLTPFPLLSLPLRPDGLQSHILKAKQKTKTQRLTCLKSMKANCSVSPWNPGTGPDLANSVGKKRG